MRIRIQRRFTVRTTVSVRSQYRTQPTYQALPMRAAVGAVGTSVPQVSTRTVTTRVLRSPGGAGQEMLYADPPSVEREWDVFISHASEDKASVVSELAADLTSLGLRVWFDATELRIGDSLRQRIDHGLAHSRFGIVVLSHAFFAKRWPQLELDGLVALEVAGKQKILPIWHGISAEQMHTYSPTLAGKVAALTSEASVRAIAEEIAQVVRNRG